MGFETVVRPVVFPNIRPAPARALPIEDAPDKGLAVIAGGSNSLVDLPFSEQHSGSTNRAVEKKRTFDKVRLYYTRPEGTPAGMLAKDGTAKEDTVDKSEYWEFEVLRKLEYQDDDGKQSSEEFAPIAEAENIEVIERNQTRTSADS